MNLRVSKEILYVVGVVTACLLPGGCCKPVEFKDITGQLKDTNPCHVVHVEPKSQVVTEGTMTMTEDKLSALTGRSQVLFYEIEKIKQMITKKYNTTLIKKCITSQVPASNISLSCTNSSFTTLHQTTECMVSTYQILDEFSSSIKLIEVKDFDSKKNLRYVLKLLNNLETYIDQALCELQIDLGLLGYNMSDLAQTHGEQPIIFADFTVVTETKYNKECMNDGILNELQVLHGIYQFLDTFSNVTQDITAAFSVQGVLESPTVSSQQINTTYPTTSNETVAMMTSPSFLIDWKKIMVG